MQVLGFSEFRKNLASALDYVETAHAPVIVKRGNTSAVMLSLDDYNAHMETIHLLSNPANAMHLLKGIQEVAQGKTTQRALTDD
ncbi:MAG: type II toxin-antitoxin system Phd/YefM family antitoxin [Moraxella sp.]